ncbi:MAG: quinone oxidoreductase [Burkholderiaceae bacterium]
MPRAIVMRAHGAPDVLVAEDVEVGAPGPGQIRLRQQAIGVNFHDVYVRTGQYRTLSLPGTPGIEAVGVVEQVGPGVSELRPGDRVGYVTGGYGAYAAVRLLPAEIAIRLPDGLDAELAASVLLKGLTVQMLVRQVAALRAGQTILVHAAAGGVGRLLCQWAAHLGVTVIGTTGSEEKAEIARRAGCAHVVLYRQQNFVERVSELTGGRGVDVAYDAVGRDTFMGSLACLGMRGHLVNFGQASGPVEPFAVSLLSQKSNTVSRPILFHYTADAASRTAMANELFAALDEGWLTAVEPRVFALEDAAGAHALLESAAGSAPLVLRPSGVSR